MKMIIALGRVLMLISAGNAVMQADILFDITDQLIASDPTQLGRLSRNGIQQDWAGSEPFSGVINPTTSYHYTTYPVNVGITPFIQIDFASINTSNTFISAYDVSYAPDSAGAANFGFDVNWLGDAGASGNFFGVDPRFFNVIATPNTNLIVVVNDTDAASAGLLQPYHVTVEGYVDADFTPTPEPSMFLACFAGLAVILFVTRFRKPRRLAV
jgi:hypothetical protein